MKNNSSKENNLWMEDELKRLKKDTFKSIKEEEVVLNKLALRTLANYFANYIKEKYPDIERKNMSDEMVEKICVEVINEISEIRNNINENISKISKIKYIQQYKKLLDENEYIRKKTKEIEKYGKIQNNTEEVLAENKKAINNIIKKTYDFLKQIELTKTDSKWKEEVLKQYINGDKNKKKSLKNKYPQLLTPETIKYIEVMVGPIEVRMEKYCNQVAQQNINYNEEIVKENEIELLKNVYKFMLRTEGIYIYNQRHINNMNLMTRTNLSYSKISSGDSVGIQEFFSEEFLKKQNLENLNSYTIFWVNKYVKEMQNINLGLTALWQLDLFGDIAKGKDILISRENIKAVRSQVDFLKRVYVKIMSKVKIGKNADEIIRQLDKKYGKKYTQTMYINPGDQSKLEQDIRLNSMMNDAIYNGYAIKEILLINKLVALKSGKENINYGIIPGSRTEKVVCIGIDEKGLNMPLVVHAPTQLLIKTFGESGIECDIPIYLGDEDFYADKRISTNMLMPLSKTQINNIKKRLKELFGENRQDCIEYRFLEHILANQYPKKKPQRLRPNKNKEVIYLNTGREEH